MPKLTSTARTKTTIVHAAILAMGTTVMFAASAQAMETTSKPIVKVPEPVTLMATLTTVGGAAMIKYRQRKRKQ